MSWYGQDTIHVNINLYNKSILSSIPTVSWTSTGKPEILVGRSWNIFITKSKNIYNYTGHLPNIEPCKGKRDSIFVVNESSTINFDMHIDQLIKKFFVYLSASNIQQHHCTCEPLYTKQILYVDKKSPREDETWIHYISTNNASSNLYLNRSSIFILSRNSTSEIENLIYYIKLLDISKTFFSDEAMRLPLSTKIEGHFSQTCETWSVKSKLDKLWNFLLFFRRFRIFYQGVKWLFNVIRKFLFQFLWFCEERSV